MAAMIPMTTPNTPPITPINAPNTAIQMGKVNTNNRMIKSAEVEDEELRVAMVRGFASSPCKNRSKRYSPPGTFEISLKTEIVLSSNAPIC